MARAEGYFPRRESVLWMVHRERAVGRLYGQRSLLVQATHPLAFTGLMANTKGVPKPFHRLAHTAVTMETVFFGSRAEADAATARVRELHSLVRGRIPEPAGPWPAGTEYRADAPDLLLWILACLADSAEAAYTTIVRPLDPSECERFWQDYLLVGELFGLDRADAPRSYRGYREYMDERLASDDLHVLPEAQEIATRVALQLPLPAPRRFALPAVNLLVVSLLPARVRELYGLPWTPKQETRYRRFAAALRTAHPIMKRGASAREYRMVARTERRRQRRAKRTAAPV